MKLNNKYIENVILLTILTILYLIFATPSKYFPVNIGVGMILMGLWLRWYNSLPRL